MQNLKSSELSGFKKGFKKSLLCFSSASLLLNNLQESSTALVSETLKSRPYISNLNETFTEINAF